MRTIVNSFTPAVLVLGAAMTGALAVPAAHAGHGEAIVSAAADPDDVGSRLDIQRERVRVHDRVATLRIRTHEGWPCRYLQDASAEGDTASAALVWEVDRNSDGTLDDRVGDFECRDGALVFVLADPSGQHSSKEYAATRPDRRSAVVRVPVRALGGDAFAVRAVSRVTGVTGDNVLFEEDDVSEVLVVGQD